MSKKKITILIAAVLIAAVTATTVFLTCFHNETSTFTASPAVTIETPSKISRLKKGQFSLDVKLTSLGKASYPASSFSIDFDSSKLEFMGIGEGNVTVTDAGNTSGHKLPEWSVNVDRSNKIGQINIMYLDTTGGKYAFSNSLLSKEKNVLMKLKFRLRDSVSDGDICELSFCDAVFAASDDTKSLASANGTLKTNNGRIVIGE